MPTRTRVVTFPLRDLPTRRCRRTSACRADRSACLVLRGYHVPPTARRERPRRREGCLSVDARRRASQSKTRRCRRLVLRSSHFSMLIFRTRRGREASATGRRGAARCRYECDDTNRNSNDVFQTHALLSRAGSQQLLPLEELLQVKNLPHAQADAHRERDKRKPRDARVRGLVQVPQLRLLLPQE